MEKVPNQTPRVRFAPSPTGNLHVGGARTALFNFLFAQKHRGAFILRLEDTDRIRSKKEFAEDIHEQLNWLGIPPDETYTQSERGEIYEKYIGSLLEHNRAYLSKEPAKNGEGKIEVVRFRNPNKEISFHDLIRGDITFDTTELGDFVIARNKREPLYHLAVVIDDFEMGITHIIRGDDGISNTPRQILIQEALEAPRPLYAHIPLILGTDRAKLSKRFSASSINTLRGRGYIPQAVINYLALLGWNPGTEQEVFSMEALIDQFDLEHVQKSGAIFDIEKLNWLNRKHLMSLSMEECLGYLKEFLPESIPALPSFSLEKMCDILPSLVERDVATLQELSKAIQDGEYHYFFAPPHVEKHMLLQEGKLDQQETITHLKKATHILQAIPEKKFTQESVKEALWEYATEVGRGKVLWPLRVALSGKKYSPDPFLLASTLEKREVLNRVSAGLALLEKES